jgi:hypothetical protein
VPGEKPPGCGWANALDSTKVFTEMFASAQQTPGSLKDYIRKIRIILGNQMDQCASYGEYYETDG